VGPFHRRDVAEKKGECVPGQPSYLISIIDDDESIREAVAGLMGWLGYKVKMFSSAVEFLAFPEFADTSCIIADVQMPQMTGIQLHDQLRLMGHDIPMILITAFPDNAVRARALADGVRCYLGKPFDHDTLIGCVRAALQTRT
jgi:FixJ family two-component response regulator